MILKLKTDATKIPTDVYGAPCPDAVASDVLTSIDKQSKILIINYAVWRNIDEMERNEPPIAQGSYTWVKDEVPAVYADEAHTELLVPKYGAFESVFQNINIDNTGNTTFGQVGQQWLLLAINPYGDKWGANWEIVS